MSRKTHDGWDIQRGDEGANAGLPLIFSLEHCWTAFHQLQPAPEHDLNVCSNPVDRKKTEDMPKLCRGGDRSQDLDSFLLLLPLS